MSVFTDDRLVDIIDEIMNERSKLLFDKPYQMLSLQELDKLNQYNHDLAYPIWKPVMIDDKDTGYKISNVGNVIDRYNHELKYYQYNPEWYISVYIPSIDNILVHRLVATAFIPNPENKPQVNHINGKKGFNWVGNLEWVTAKENSEHAWRTNLVNNNGELHGSSVYTNEQIKEVCKLLETNEFTHSKIEQLTGVKQKTISDIRIGKKWKSISKDYKLPKSRPKMYTDDMIIETCKLLENPSISHQQISRLTGVSINCIKDIMKKTSYRRISDRFNIQKRINAGQYSPISRYSKDQISEVCYLIKNTTLSVKDISSRTGVGISSVYDVIRGTRWKSIAQEYGIININQQIS